MLELRSIHKRLGSFHLSQCDLCVREGEYFVLLGPSGVGKTVLVEIIAGLMRPDSGTILWRGEDITLCAPESRGFAVVYQDYCLFPHMKVLENVTYGTRTAGFRSRGRARPIDALVETLGIADLLSRWPESLSGGEQQRVALARALATNPRMLILDEPLSALDLENRVRLRKELKRIHTESRIPFLHVTHDREEAMSLGDRIGVMLGHRIAQIGTPEDLFRRPSDRQVAGFLGMRNVMAVRKVHNGYCHVGNVDIHVAEADESVSYIWIKPEEIVLSKEPFDSSARNQLKCMVVEWEHSGTLLAIHVLCGDLPLTALITYTSFERLGVEPGKELYATFKSSAVHCF